MGDFSLNYSNNIKGMIFFSYGNQVVDFKPFIDTFSYSYSNASEEAEDSTIYNKNPRASTFKESKFNVSFNVLSSDVNEAVENHKKFQILLRMIIPGNAEGLRSSKNLSVKFSNLISNKGQQGKNNMSAALVQSEGFLGSISSLNYQPEMELGFFEFNGLIFAKSFKITFDLTAVPQQNKANIPMFRSGLSYGRKYPATANITTTTTTPTPPAAPEISTTTTTGNPNEAMPAD
tara:strand:+ start:4764 stop:5462 length:699 start_codon:yes stop_codon:yes gene_type:complete